MSVWASTLQPQPRFQFEQSSGTPSKSQIFNCGPTGSSQQADFYNNRGNRERPYYGIEATRLMAGVPQGRPTNAWEQADMCDRRGVPASAVWISSLVELDHLLGEGGRRPIGMGWLMSRLTAHTRGHSFLGWHRVTVLKGGRRWNWRRMRFVLGYIYTDPNFNPVWRPDPKKGHRFISRAELRHVLDIGTWSIVPDHAKGAR